MNAFKTRKTVMIEYAASEEEVLAMEKTREVLDDLITELDKNEEYSVYFNGTLYTREDINAALHLLINMSEYTSDENILNYHD